MSEIRQALIKDIICEIGEYQIGECLEGFLTLGNYHMEEQLDILGRTGGIEVLDIHFLNISFALPLYIVEDIIKMKLYDNIGKYLNINGVDVQGNTRRYSIMITEDVLKKIAWHTYLAFTKIRGGTYFVDNISEWESWMK